METPLPRATVRRGARRARRARWAPRAGQVVDVATAGEVTLRCVCRRRSLGQTRSHLPAWLGVGEALACGAFGGGGDDDAPLAALYDLDAIAAEDARVDAGELAEVRSYVM